jgi:hypothetical protein
VLNVRPPGATVSVDDGPPEPLPPGGVVYLAPGVHRLVLGAEGHDPVARAIEVSANAEERLDVTLVRERTAAPSPSPGRPTATPSPSSGARDGGGVPIATWGFGAASVAAFGLAAVTGVMALSRQSDVDDARAAWRRGESVDRGAIEDEASTGETLALVTDVALAVGVVSAGVAVVFLLRGEGDDDRPAAIQAIVAPGQGRLVVAVQGPLP